MSESPEIIRARTGAWLREQLETWSIDRGRLITPDLIAPDRLDDLLNGRILPSLPEVNWLTNAIAKFTDDPNRSGLRLREELAERAGYDFYDGEPRPKRKP